MLKTQINIENSNKSHTKIINQIKDGTNILDVGCAGGHIGEYLFKEKKCTVVGIDYKIELLDMARTVNAYKSLHQIDLNDLTYQLDQYLGNFDYIVAADVIEHLYSPDKIIKKLITLLKDDGRMILSIPNISHGSIKFNLLDNKFNYTSEGLLDSTHIRFFTLDSIIELVTKLNLEILSLDSVIYFVNHTEQKVELNKYPNSVTKFIEKNPESYIYQYVLNVKKSSLTNHDLLDKNTKLAENKLQEVNKCIKKIKIKQIITAPERFIRKNIVYKFRMEKKIGKGK